MERRRNLLKKVLIYVLTVAVVLSNGMFMNLKKAKAETYYQYLVHFSKPFTMTGSLKNTIEGIMKSSSVLKKSEDSLCVEYLINEKSDYVNMYKNIVANLDASTLVNPGFYIRAMVGMGNKLSDTPQNATLAEAKNLISNDAQNHRSLYIYWQCGHIYDSSRWQLTSAATCQHNNQYRCTICGETKSEGNTISHNYSSCISGATCQQPAVYKCTMCNSTINQGSTIGHNYSTYVSGATCQHPAIYKCTMCSNTTYSGGYANHTWAQKSAATCTQGQVLYCTTCGTQTAGAGATGHNYSSVSVTAPTSSSKGYTRHRCGCGAYYDDTFTYKVEYDANGGYGNVASQTINYDKSENLKQNSFGRSYYHFTGWNTKADGSGKAYSAGQLIKNITTTTVKLYAQWQKNKYSVTCIDYYEDGKVIDSVNNNKTVQVDYDTKISGQYFGTDTKIGAYYPGTKYVSCDGEKTVSGNITVKRFFKDYRENGLNGAVINSGTLVSMSEKPESVKIPEEVKRIGDGAFKDQDKLISVDIKNGTVNEIGAGAFKNCISLKKIVVPYSVRKIEKNAFIGCSSLDEIIIKNPDCEIDRSFETIPQNAVITGFSNSSAQSYSKENHRNYNKITTIGEDFFAGEKYLERFNVPSDVVIIGDRAFKNCTALKKITLGNVTRIGDEAFAGCTSLKYESDYEKITKDALVIPKTTEYIGKKAFAGDKEIKEIVFEGKETVISDKSSIDAGTLIGCYAGSKQYDFSVENKYKIILFAGFENDGTTEFADEYRDSDEIAAVIMGAGIEKIGRFAFAGCKSLENVSIMGDRTKKTAVTIDNSAFYNCTELKKVMSDKNISELGDNVFFNCEKLNEVTFSDNNMLAKIGNRAFYGCVSLSEIKINNPNCVINENNDTFSENTILRGWSKSTTNDYSKKNNRKFECIGISYCVEFDKKGGDNGTDGIFVYSGMKMPDIEVPEKKGYTFCGYASGDSQLYNDAGKYISGEVLNISEDMTGKKALSAKWCANCYSVWYMPNGTDGEQTEQAGLLYDTEFKILDNMYKKEGYTFAGWSTLADGSSEIYKAGESIKNLTDKDGEVVRLYARWQENSYNIEYNLNGGTGEAPENKEIMYQSEYTIADNKSTKEYYVFAGWNTRYDGKGTSYEVGQKVSRLTAVKGDKIILYAQWKPVEYSISYDFDGGETETNVNPLKYDCETDDFTVVSPKKHGWDFVGWHDSDKLHEGAYVVKKGSHGDITLKAVYRLSEYSIKFETNGGEFKDEKSRISSYRFGDDVNLPMDVEKKNYVFKGWSADKDKNDTYVAKIEPDDTGDKCFYAVWTPESYKIKYMLDGGKTEDGSPMAYLYGTGVKLPESAKKEGYSFAGWYQDEKFSGQRIEKITENESGDKVIYAKWIPNVTDKDKSDSDLSGNKPLDTKNPSESSLPHQSKTPDDSYGTDKKDNVSESTKPEVTKMPLQTDALSEQTKTPLVRMTASPNKQQGAGKNSAGESSNTEAKTNKKTAKYNRYNKNKKTVALKKFCDTKAKKAIIPDSITKGGVRYKVTSVAADAFSGCKKLKEVTIGKNIKTIGKNCFKNCHSLKKINIRSKIFRKAGKNSLKGTNKKLIVSCNKKKMTKYKKLLKNRGNNKYKMKEK